jgi:hypothetical protein
MVRSVVMFVVLALASVLPVAAADPSDDIERIRATALDYIEGWYQADAARMERSLHPDLAKRRVDGSGARSELEQITAAELVAGTAAGGGRNTPAQRQRSDVQVLDVFGNTASVRVDADGWIDYMHLARVDGEWKIVNVLWELRR